MGCTPELSRPINADAVPSDVSEPSAAIVTLSAVEIESEDDRVQVVLSGSRPFTFELENLDNPPRLMVDVSQAQVEQSEAHEVARGGIESVRLEPLPGAEQMVRLEIELADHASYRLTKESQRLIVLKNDTF